MKKMRILVCGIALAALLAGCGESGQTAEETTDITLAQEEETMVKESEESVKQTLPESTSNEQAETPQAVQEMEEVQTTQGSNINEEGDKTVMKMNVQIGEATFTASLLENEAVDALKEMMEEAPVVIRMSDYSGFEKVGALETSLPTSNSQTTTQAGDIVLYQGNQIVIFYGSNSWSYTRLGHIDDLTGWEEALGSGDVTVTFSLQD